MAVSVDRGYVHVAGVGVSADKGDDTLWVSLQTEGMNIVGVGVSVDRRCVHIAGVGVSVERGYVHVLT